MSDIYENATEIELESLEAIYVSELKYSRNSDGQVDTIELLLHPATGHDVTKQYVCMTLVFTLSSKYPDEPPTIEIRNPRGLGEEEVSSLLQDMILKAGEMAGEAMLYTLIEMAKDSITEGNIPHCPCVVCLEHFHQRDRFHRTACYHFFHCHCLYKYLLHTQAQLEAEEKEVSERRHLDAVSSDQGKTRKLLCPVCRSPLDEASLAVTCSQEELEEDEKTEEFVVPPVLREQQRKMAEMFEHQKAKGGIIDLEHEKNKYLLNSEDRMPVRSQRPTQMTVTDSRTTSGTTKDSTVDRQRERPTGTRRQDGSTQQYRGKGRDRTHGNYHPSRSQYEVRSGPRPRTGDGAGRRTNNPPGFGSRRTKELAETDLRGGESSEQRNTLEENREYENRRRVREKEMRMRESDKQMMVGITDRDLSNEDHGVSEGLKRPDERDKIDTREDNIVSYERRNETVLSDRKNKDVEDGRWKVDDNEYKSIESGRGGSSVRAFSTRGGQRREENSRRGKSDVGESQGLKANICDGDESNENEKEKNIVRKLVNKQGETELVKNEAESVTTECRSSSSSYIDASEISRETIHGEVYTSSREKGSNPLRAHGDEERVRTDVYGASGPDGPSERRRNNHLDGHGEEYTGYGRGRGQRDRRGHEKDSGGYQRGGERHRGRGSEAGSKQRGSKFSEGRDSKFHEGQGSYASYSERSYARNDRTHQQQYQRQHQHHQQRQHHNRRGEEREQVDRSLRATEERNVEDEVNSEASGQGACRRNVTSEPGSKDDDDAADDDCQFVHPPRRKSSFVFSDNAADKSRMRKAVPAANEYLPDTSRTRGKQKTLDLNRVCVENMGCDNITDNDSGITKTETTGYACSMTDLRMCHGGYDEADGENWEDEIDVYYYERYKIRPEYMEDYLKQTAVRRKQYTDRLKEKHEQQQMIATEQRRILKERIERNNRSQNDELKSPVKTKEEKRVKSVLELFKEEKEKASSTSSVVSKICGSRVKSPIVTKTTVKCEPEEVWQDDSIQQHIVPTYTEDFQRHDVLAYVCHETSVSTFTCPDITGWSDVKENIAPHDSSNQKSFRYSNDGKIGSTKREETKAETFMITGGDLCVMMADRSKDLQATNSSCGLGDLSLASDVVCCRNGSSRMSVETGKDDFPIGNGVSRKGVYWNSLDKGDHQLDIGGSGGFYQGDLAHIGVFGTSSCICRGVSRIRDGDLCQGHHTGCSVSHTSDCIDRGVSRISDYPQKGVSHTSDGMHKGVSHIRGGDICQGNHRNTNTYRGVPLKNDYRNSDLRGYTDTNEHKITPGSAMKTFIKAPPLKFSKTKMQTRNNCPAQILDMKPAAAGGISVPEHKNKLIASFSLSDKVPALARNRDCHSLEPADV